MISIFCDGSSSGGNHKPGGWGFVIVRNDEVLLWSYGGHPETTNNKMELQAAIAGLEGILYLGLDKEAVELCSDSQYTLGIATGAYHPTTNLEQTSTLRNLVARVKNLQCRWVKGHAGDKWNEKADELAGLGKEANGGKPQRKTKPISKRAARRARVRELTAKILSDTVLVKEKN